MKFSLRDRIKAFFKRNPDTFINGGDIEKLAQEAGYKSSNASRRLRELENEGILLREIRKGKGVASVWYRLSPTKYKTIEFHTDNKIIKQATLI